MTELHMRCLPLLEQWKGFSYLLRILFLASRYNSDDMLILFFDLVSNLILSPREDTEKVMPLSYFSIKTPRPLKVLSGLTVIL